MKDFISVSMLFRVEKTNLGHYKYISGKTITELWPLQLLLPNTKYLRCVSGVDDCASNPCHNGATCIDGEGWHSCNCSPGFTGPVCKVNINECNSSPCSDGATCRDKINGFECICPPGKFGARCQGKIIGGGKFLKKLWCYVGGKYNEIIWFYQLSW